MKRIFLCALIMTMPQVSKADVIASYIIDLSDNESANVWLGDSPANPEYCPKMKGAHSASINTNSKFHFYSGFREIAIGCWLPTKDHQIKLYLKNIEDGKRFDVTYSQERFETSSSFKSWHLSSQEDK